MPIIDVGHSAKRHLHLKHPHPSPGAQYNSGSAIKECKLVPVRCGSGDILQFPRTKADAADSQKRKSFPQWLYGILVLLGILCYLLFIGVEAVSIDEDQSIRPETATAFNRNFSPVQPLRDSDGKREIDRTVKSKKLSAAEKALLLYALQASSHRSSIFVSGSQRSSEDSKD